MDLQALASWKVSIRALQRLVRLVMLVTNILTTVYLEYRLYLLNFSRNMTSAIHPHKTPIQILRAGDNLPHEWEW